MSKPVLSIEITTLDEKTGKVDAVFDSGSFYSIIHADKLPSTTVMVPRKTPRVFSAAAKGSKLSTIGEVSLVLRIGEKEIDDTVLVSSELNGEMLVGAGTMQKWDISIINQECHTKIEVGRDMHDPQITAVV